MKNKKGVSLYITLASTVTVLYVVFAAKPLEEEFQFIPEWKIDVANPTVQKTAGNESTHFFRLAQSLGYFTDDGKVTNFVSFPFKATVSENIYAVYSANSSACDFYSKDGQKTGTINEYGFPMFDEDRIFVFFPGGSSVGRMDSEGKKIWEYESTSPITAFDSSKAGCVLGFADGRLIQFSDDGNILRQFSPGGSEFQVISGAAVSPCGQFIASVSGMNKERFVLAKQEDAHSKIVFHEFTEKSRPYQKLVKFSGDGKKVYYDFDGTLGIVDTETTKSQHIKIKGRSISLKESERCVFLLTKQADEYTVYIIEKNSELVGSFSFKAKAAFIQTDSENLFVGKDSTISKINIQKK